MISLSAYTSEPLSAIGLEVLFRSCEDITLRVISNLTTLLRQVTCEKPDVLLLGMNERLDWELLTTLRQESASTRIVLWLHEISPELAYQARERGVSGILRKTLAPEMIFKCARKVHGGELWFEKTLTEAFLNGHSIKVSKREGELIALVAQGLKNKEIAESMCISEGTVKVYLSRLFEKVGARDRVELALIGMRWQDDGSFAPLAYPYGSSIYPDKAIRKTTHSRSTCVFFPPAAAR